jgi:carbon-monoxide dehydrogenase small subunit
LTIEGLAQEGALHPLQESFMELGAIQCGFCTPGMILAAYALLKEKSSPSRQDILDGLSGNLCRCTGYHDILRAVNKAAKAMRKGQ